MPMIQIVLPKNVKEEQPGRLILNKVVNGKEIHKLNCILRHIDMAAYENENIG